MMRNNSASPLVLTDLPTSLEWEYGGFAYGLEPLTMPDPWSPDAPGSYQPTPDGYRDACRLIRLAGGHRPATAARDCRPDDELYWFRWITGHQVSFISWRLMAQLIADAEGGLLAVPAALPRLCAYLRVYTAMLLYTGSCPQDVYQDVIRPSMRLRHPSFSGAWAPDYWPVRDLLRGRRLPFTGSPGAAELRETVDLQRLVHDGIAEKLVPDGRSLLRQSGARGLDLKLMHVIYDNYFMTLRAPVSPHDVVAQLLRRLVAVAQDVAVNGLNPAAENRAELPEELRMSEVIEYEDNFIDILSDTAYCAARLMASGRESLARSPLAARSATHSRSPHADALPLARTGAS
jgi:L-tyrosine peroxygenase